MREFAFHDPPNPTPSGVSEVAVGRHIALYVTVVVLGAAIGCGLAWLPLTVVIGGLIALCSLFLILARPYIGLLLFTVLFVLRPGEIWPLLGALHLERIIGSLALVSLALEQRHRERQLVVDGSRQTRFLLLFVVAVALSVPLAYWRSHAVDGLMDVIRILAYYIMVVHLVNTRARFKYFVWTFCLMMAFVGGASLYTYFNGGAFFAQGINRAVGITSFGNNPNELGTTLGSALPIFLLLSLSRSCRGGRPVLGVVSLAMLVAIVLTGSRASMLGLLAGLAYLCWRTRYRIVASAVALCLAIFSFGYMPAQYQARYASILDKRSAGRVVLWKAGLRMFVDRPLFGVGIGCFGSANGMKYSGEARNWMASHSLYVQVLAELGLVGTITFFSFLREMLQLNRSTARRLASTPGWSFEKTILDAIFAGLLVLLVSGVFGHSLLRRTWYVYAGMGLAVLRIYLQQQESPKAVDSALAGR